MPASPLHLLYRGTDEGVVAAAKAVLTLEQGLGESRRSTGPSTSLGPPGTVVCHLSGVL